MTPASQRRLAGIPDDVPPDQASVYHATAREAALQDFACAYERELPAPSGTGDPEYVVSPSADGELLVIAGVWPAAEQTCGRLVAPRELFELLLEDLETTAVWCDDSDGEGLAITGHAISAGGQPMLLAVARSARVTGEREGVSQVEYAESRVAEGEWSMDALGSFLEAHDGDAVVLHASILAELAGIVGGMEEIDQLARGREQAGAGPDGLT